MSFWLIGARVKRLTCNMLNMNDIIIVTVLPYHSDTHNLGPLAVSVYET